MSLEKRRREYRYGTLDSESLSSDPIKQFSDWMSDAIDKDLGDPTAMCLATTTPDGRPSQRVVLLKGYSASGFVFFTNLSSRKATEIEANSHVCLLFPWLHLDRQVIIEGKAHSLDREDVGNYFIQRPVEAKLAAWASKQSKPIQNRACLEERYENISLRFYGKGIPVPEFWGGYRVAPDNFEFWQGGERRLHDRFRYSKNESDSTWTISRLAP